MHRREKLKPSVNYIFEGVTKANCKNIRKI
nr:MAG TPA: hypothetical protein [Caudoviricetes sp.]